MYGGKILLQRAAEETQIRLPLANQHPEAPLFKICEGSKNLASFLAG